MSAEEVISYILHKNPHRHLDQESDDDEHVAGDDFNGMAGNNPEAMHRSSLYSHAPPPSNGNTRWRGAGGQGGSDQAPPRPHRSAERAAMRSLRVHRQYIIVDCRPKEAFESCRLAPALHLDPELLVSPDDLDAKLKEYIPLQVRVACLGCHRCSLCLEHRHSYCICQESGG